MHSMTNCKYIDKCPITNSESKIIYLNLGLMPLVNNLNNTKEESLNCPKYPLAVQLFEESGLSTLTVEIDPKILYQYYLYKSGISLPYIEHCQEMFGFVDTYLQLKEGDKVLDIGGNDGTLLKTFLNKKPYLDVLNIDASENLTNEAKNNGINSINAFWGHELAEKLNTKFRLITTTNCFQHTAPIESFVKGISTSLDKFGIWCLEFPYWKTSIETNQFDQVYHEHIYYYNVEPLIKLFDKHNLRVIKAIKYPIHGGTMRLLVTHKGELGEAFQQCSYSVPPTLQKENFIVDNYIEWGNKIQNNISKSKDFLLSLKNQGYKIGGFGAAAKGCIYLNAAQIDHNIIDYIIDDTNLKQGKFVPGVGIEIVSRKALETHPVDYMVILAHNFSEYIIKSLKQDGYQGKFIIFLPELNII
jgi:hypothetical protein